MTRLFMLTFLGDDRDHHKFAHAHESPALITVPLVLLAALSVVAGGALAHNGFIEKALPAPTISVMPGAAAVAAPAAVKEEPAASVPAEDAAKAAVPEARAEAGAKEGAGEEAEMPTWLAATVIVLVLAAMSLAFFLYRGPDFAAAEAIRAAFGPLVTVLDRRWYLDDAFLALVALCDQVALLAFWIDQNVVDRIFVDGWGLLMRIFAEISNFLDISLVDATVDGVGALSNDLGGGLRSLVVDGQVQEYMMYAAIAFSLAATLILTR
jgi:NADH-quinone oxidoreductase subunit L